MRERVAVLWVGHGSASDAAVGDAVLAHVARARAALPEVVHEVAFWRGEPGLRGALDRIAAERVVIVPCFISAGYFVDRVLPRELRIDGAQVARWQRVGPRHVWWSLPLGLLDEAGAVVAARLDEACQAWGMGEGGAPVSVLVVGHGTRRHGASAAPALDEARALEARVPAGWEVQAAFIDQAPEVEGALARCQHQDVVVIPHFVAPGGHTRQDIPAALGAAPGLGWPQQVAGRRVGVTAETGSAAVMTAAAVRQVRAALACAAEMTARQALPVDEAQAWWVERLHKARGEGLGEWPFSFGQVLISADDGAWWLTHVQVSSQDTPPPRWLDAADEDALLAAVRQDDTGALRGLLGAPTLPVGLRVRARDAAQVVRAMALIYPGALLARWAEAVGGLEITSLPDAVARQSGLLARLKGAVEALPAARWSEPCAGCLRRPVWAPAHAPATQDAGPCGEPCVFAMASLLEVVSDLEGVLS